MGTIFQKLNYLDGTKGLIRQAINDKGGTLTEDNTFRSYADAISGLPSGGISYKWDFTKSLTDDTGTHTITPKGTYTLSDRGLMFTENQVAPDIIISPLSYVNVDIRLRFEMLPVDYGSAWFQFFALENSNYNNGLCMCKGDVDGTTVSELVWIDTSNIINRYDVVNSHIIDVKISTKNFTDIGEIPKCDVALNILPEDPEPTWHTFVTDAPISRATTSNTYINALLGGKFTVDTLTPYNQAYFKLLEISTKD